MATDTVLNYVSLLVVLKHVIRHVVLLYTCIAFFTTVSRYFLLVHLVIPIDSSFVPTQLRTFLVIVVVLQPIFHFFYDEDMECIRLRLDEDPPELASQKYL